MEADLSFFLVEVAAKTEVKRSKTMKYVSCLIRFFKKIFTIRCVFDSYELFVVGL